MKGCAATLSKPMPLFKLMEQNVLMREKSPAELQPGLWPAVHTSEKDDF